MFRKSFLSIVALSLSLSTINARPAAAATVGDPLTAMVQAGWKPVSEGVLQRSKGGNKVESLVTGVKGFTWKLRQLEAQLEILRSDFEANPTLELRRAIAAQRKAVVSTKQLIQRLQANPGATDGKISCTINFGYDSDAYPLSSAVGVGATANANFNSNCSFSGEVYAYSYSKATTQSGLVTTLTKVDGPRSGANVSASAVGSVNGVTDCYSHAESSMTSNSISPSSYYIVDDNYTCPSVMNVTVTNDWGSSDIYVQGYDCAYINWTTSISGGAPAYSTAMYQNNAYMTSSTSFANTFCGSNSNWTQTVTVSSNVTDSAGQSKSASQVTTIHYLGSTYTGGCSVAPDGSGKIAQDPTYPICP
jgi:hypothetical protein